MWCLLRKRQISPFGYNHRKDRTENKNVTEKGGGDRGDHEDATYWQFRETGRRTLDFPWGME